MRSAWLPLTAAALVAVLAGRDAPAGRTRTYYIAADSVTWDYVPGGSDAIAGHPFADTAYFRDSAHQPVRRPTGRSCTVSTPTARSAP